MARHRGRRSKTSGRVSDVDLRHIETFLVLCEELHFARTADRLYLAPGRVSRLIRELEREVGAPLFERTSRRVSLLPAGERFRDGARRGLAELGQALDDVRQSVRCIAEVVRVGYQASIRTHLGIQLAATFEERYPRSRVLLTALHGGLDSPFEGLRRGEFDMALVGLPGGDARAAAADDLSFGPILETHRRAVAVAAHHPLAGRLSVRLEDLVDYELLLPDTVLPPAYADAWTPRVTPSGRPLRRTRGDLGDIIGRDRYSIDDLLAMLARSDLAYLTVASLRQRFVSTGLAMVPITDLPPCVIVPMWRTAAENASIRALRNVAGDLARRPVTQRPAPQPKLVLENNLVTRGVSMRSTSGDTCLVRDAR
jgi:DNA-binding transcriptional LysR family regulator